MPDETMQGNAQYRLARLEDLDGYHVAEGEPDPRGWDVRAADGRTIGHVDSLIADTGSMKVRYLDVALDKDALDLTEDRHVLIPIGGATLAEKEDVVGLPSLQSSRVAQLPAYRHAGISREDEHRLMGQFDSRYTAAPYADFYSHQHFNDQAFFGSRRRKKDGAAYLTRSEEELAVGKQRVKAGEVGVTKRVETEHVKKSVPVVREEVTVERRPASASTTGSASIRDDEVRVPLMEEQVVVEKRVVPKEEVIITKHAKRDTKTVEADLRKEQVDIDTKGAARIDEKR